MPPNPIHPLAPDTAPGFIGPARAARPRCGRHRARLLLAAAWTAIACAAGGPRGSQGPGFYSARIVKLASGAGDGTPAVAAIKLPSVRSHPAALYLDGSGCRSVVHLMPYLDELVQRGYAVVALEKRGVVTGADGSACSREFLEHDTREEREAAARAAIAGLPHALPGWNGELLVIAASEATSFAATATRGVARLQGLVLLGGGGWPQAHELAELQERRLLRRGATERERAAARDELEERFLSIARDPSPEATWLGATHRRWASYLRHDPMPDLLAVEAPVYMANGVRDSMVPVESARAVAQAFSRAGKSNLTAREYAALDHTWTDAEGRSHFAAVARDLLEWLARHAPRPPPGG